MEKRRRGIQLAIAVGLGVLFFIGFSGFIPAHALHGDEVYYIGRSMQNLAFLEGQYPLNLVTFSTPNHPFTGELLIGLGMLAQGQAFAPSTDVYGGMPASVLQSEMSNIPLNATHLTPGELDGARLVSLLIAAIALVSIVYLATELNPLLGLFGFLFAVSMPGLIDISVMAMLDVYSAAFTALSVLAIYWYTRGSRAALVANGVFLGLAVGSKLSLDPLIAAVVAIFCVLVREESNWARARRLGQNWIAAFVAFAATSPVVVLRLSDEIRDSFSSSAARTALANLTSLVSRCNLVSKCGSIFGYIQPPVLVVYALVTSSAVILALQTWRKGSSQGRTSRLMRWRSTSLFLRTNPETFFLIAVTAFSSLDLLLSPLIFEYSRNFQRLGLYMVLSSIVSLAYLVRNFRWRKAHLLVGAACFFAVLLVDDIFLATLGARIASGTFTYASLGYTVVMASLMPEAGALLVLSGTFVVLVFLGIFGASIAEVFVSSRRAS